MTSNVENIKSTDPNEQALDGTVGGALDPESTENTDGGGVVVPFHGIDDSEVKRRTHEAIERISDVIATKRSELNADKKAIVSGLESDLGINPHAFKAFMEYYSLAEDKRANYILTFQTLCKCMDMDTQVDWIDDQDAS